MSFSKLCSPFYVTVRMSRGQYQPRNLSSRRVLERCSPRNTVEIIDVDKEKVDIVDIDAEETPLGSNNSGTSRRYNYPTDVINIDDEDVSTNESIRNVQSDAARNEYCPGSSNSPMSEESRSNECPVTSSRSMENTRNCHDAGPSFNCFNLSESSESWMRDTDDSISDSDSSDCEILEDPFGNFREQWERAALKRKMPDRAQFGSDDHASNSGLSENDARFFSEEVCYNNIDIENCIRKVCSDYSKEIPQEAYPKNSSFEKEPRSSNVPGHNGLHNTYCREDLGISDIDKNGATNIRLKNQRTGETCSHNFQSLNENLTDDVRLDFHSKPAACSSECGLNMQHATETKDDDVRDLDEDQQIPRTSTSGTRGLHGDSSILGKRSFLGQYSSPNHQPSPDSAMQEHKGHCGWEPPHTVQPHPKTISSSEIAGFQREGKSSPVDSSLCNSQCRDGVEHQTKFKEPLVSNMNRGKEATEMCNASETEPELHASLICERERHKESTEYRRAAEEEWAARQLQLQKQAEEAQKLKRRKKAETLRITDMEKRQKQRLEEIRESQKKDEETINLKEQLRAEIRKELEKLELRYRDMASLLRGLGIDVGGGPFPMPSQVHAAYKKALLRFHPDRASRFDVRQQVQAEETFKLISRLKDKLLPVM